MGGDGVLHILFIILKILGILLLVILGLLFLCLMAVLFVPIRYRGNGSYHSIKAVSYTHLAGGNIAVPAEPRARS